MSLICKECHEKLLGCCQYDGNPNDIQIGITFPEMHRIMKEKNLSYADFIVKDEIEENIINLLSTQIHPIFKGIFSGNLRFRLKTIEGKCVFLTDKGCSLSNESKPHYCKLYPFWLQKDSDKLQILLSEKCLAQKQAVNIPELMKIIGTDREEIVTIFRTLESDVVEHVEEIGNYSGKIFSNNFSFQKLTSDHKARVVEMVKDIWEGDDYLPAIYDKWVSDESGEFIGAFYEGELVGLGKLSFYALGYAWLEGLRADPNAKIRGIATALNGYFINRIQDYKPIYAIEFNTYYANFASIHCAEKHSFKKVATYSYKTLDLSESRIDLVLEKYELQSELELTKIIGFIENSSFIQENRLCRGWEAYPVIPEIINKRFIDQNQVLSITESDGISALLLFEKDYIQNIMHICFIDGDTSEQVELLLQQIIMESRKAELREVDLAVPANFRFRDLINKYNFQSMEQEEDYLMFRHQSE